MDAKPGAVHVPTDDLFECRELGVDEGPVAGCLKVVMQRLEEPECRVDGVELGRLARVVKGVGQHALIEERHEGRKDLARLLRIAGRDDGPLLDRLLPSPVAGQLPLPRLRGRVGRGP